MSRKGMGFVRTPGLTPFESSLFKMETTEMADRKKTIERLSTEYDQSMTDLFGRDYFVHSGFAAFVQRVCRGETPDDVIAQLRNPQPVGNQMAAAITGWSHDGQLGD